MVDEVKTERSQTPTPPADVASPPATVSHSFRLSGSCLCPRSSLCLWRDRDSSLRIRFVKKEHISSVAALTSSISNLLLGSRIPSLTASQKDTKAKPKKPATPRKKKTATADVVMADANDADEPGSPKAKAKKPATPRKPKVKAEVTDGDATDGAEPKEGGAEVKPKKTPTPRKRKSTSGTGEDGEPTTANGEDGDKSPTKKTPTARKRKSGSSTGDDGVAAATAAEGDDEESPTKKKKATPKSGKKTDAYPLSTSADNISEVDKMILTMKDDEGKSWVEIKAKWEEMTGMKPGNSTLGNRYAKLKSNFTVFADGDVSLTSAFLSKVYFDNTLSRKNVL